MKLTDLEPHFLKIEDERTYRMHDDIREADGVEFLYPACFTTNGGRVGTHAVICWRPHVPQTHSPRPGRWDFRGAGYADLSLVAGSSSVLLTSGCCAHFHVTNGEIVGLTYRPKG